MPTCRFLPIFLHGILVFIDWLLDVNLVSVITMCRKSPLNGSYNNLTGVQSTRKHFLSLLGAL